MRGAFFRKKRTEMRILIAWRAQFMGGAGGMEKVCTDMCNAFIRRGHQVGLLYCGEKEGRPFFPLRPEVQLMNIAAGLEGARPYMPFWAACVRELLRLADKHKMHQWVSRRKNRYYGVRVRELAAAFRPDVLVSFDLSSAMLLRESFGSSLTVPDVTMFHFPVQETMRCQSQEEKETLRSGCCVQLLTKEAEECFQREFPGVRTVCIPNAVTQYGKQADLSKEKESYTLLHVGRLDRHTKRQHLLIEAFASLADRFPQWNLELWGGVENEKYAKELAHSIDSRHLEKRVFLKGKCAALEDVYTAADVFCFPSAYEGFGLALAEAMSAGLPAVGFRSCPGVNALIRDGETGILTEDSVESFSSAMAALMDSRMLRVRMGQAGRDAMKDYAPEQIWDRWEQLLAEMIHERKP